MPKQTNLCSTSCPNCGKAYDRPRFGLTEQQKNLCDFIAHFTTKNDRWPTFEEMCAAISLKSKSGIHRMIVNLEKRGFLVRLGERSKVRKEPPIPGAREINMRLRFETGEMLPEIGKSYGISGERVRQLLDKYFGPRKKEGGKSIAVKKKRASRQEMVDKRYFAKWGHNEATHREFVRLGRELRKLGIGRERQPIGAYISQRQGARSRGIQWKFNFHTWWTFWQESGKWASRGQGADGYVMGRFGDVGPYSPSNCYIAKSPDNIRHYFDHRRGDMHEFSTPKVLDA